MFPYEQADLLYSFYTESSRTIDEKAKMLVHMFEENEVLKTVTFNRTHYNYTEPGDVSTSGNGNGGFVSSFNQPSFTDPNTGLNPLEFLNLPWNESFSVASVTFESLVFQSNNEMFSLAVSNFQLLGSGVIRKSLEINNVNILAFKNVKNLTMLFIYYLFVAYFNWAYICKIKFRYQRYKAK